jgi:hypothetical protein
MPPRPDYGLSLSANFEFNGALSLFPISGTDGSLMVPPPNLGRKARRRLPMALVTAWTVRSHRLSPARAGSDRPVARRL